MTSDRAFGDPPTTGPRRVLAKHGIVRQVEDDRDHGRVVRGRPAQQGPPRGRGHVRGIHHGGPTGRESPIEGTMERSERGAGHRLIGFVSPDRGPERVRGEHGARRERPRRERGLARAGGSDEQDQGAARDGDLTWFGHRSIMHGGPPGIE